MDDLPDLERIRERIERAYQLHMSDDTVWGRDYPDIGHDYFCDATALLATLDAWRSVLEAVAAIHLAGLDPITSYDTQISIYDVRNARRLLGQEA